MTKKKKNCCAEEKNKCSEPKNDNMDMIKEDLRKGLVYVKGELNKLFTKLASLTE